MLSRLWLLSSSISLYLLNKLVLLSTQYEGPRSIYREGFMIETYGLLILPLTASKLPSAMM